MPVTPPSARATPQADDPAGGRVDAPSATKVSMASAVGATIEWYDFFLYGTAAGLVFDKLFFNGLEGPAAQFASFGTFAVGFLDRPVGGLIFGHLGDRIGRKRMLIWTLVIMGGGTASIGLLPSYDRIGIWAPILLVLMRFSCRESASVVSGAGRCCSRAISPPRTPAACGPRPRRPGCRSERSSPTCSCSG